MCGGNENDIFDPRRFGALAIVRPQARLGSEHDNDAGDLSGQVTFFNNADHESHMATHVRFIPDESRVEDLDLDLTIL